MPRGMGADFGFGIGTTQQEAEQALKQSKKMNGYRRGDMFATIPQATGGHSEANNKVTARAS
jgi:hypothetical protein